MSFNFWCRTEDDAFFRLLDAVRASLFATQCTMAPALRNASAKAFEAWLFHEGLYRSEQLKGSISWLWCSKWTYSVLIWAFSSIEANGYFMLFLSIHLVQPGFVVKTGEGSNRTVHIGWPPDVPIPSPKELFGLDFGDLAKEDFGEFWISEAGWASWCFFQLSGYPSNDWGLDESWQPWLLATWLKTSPVRSYWSYLHFWSF